MNRRAFFRVAGSSLAIAGLPSSLRAASTGVARADGLPLFYDPADISLFRANAATDLLGTLYRQWASESPDLAADGFRSALRTGDLIGDFYQALYALQRSALVQLLDPSVTRGRKIREAIELMVSLPSWDYFREDRTEVIGFQRAPWGVVCILFARQVVAEDIQESLDRRILQAVAEKGCLPCFRTVYGMDHPEEVKGWGFDERHDGFYDLDMSRWPMIVGANNLRADPSAALGIGALALQGKDARADEWLARAKNSLRRVMSFFEPDGSFFEAISYAAYTWRTSFSFFEAHERVVGDTDWSKEFDLDRFLDFILTSQAGRSPEGAPDVLNFGDTFGSVNPCVPAWIGRKTGNPLAQFVADKVSDPRFFFDFLWYRPGRPAKHPSAALENVRNDLDWIFCRTGWAPEDAVLGFRSGGPANHEHADRNSFIYKIHGERLLNDPFRADYDWRQPRWILRLTESHNAVLVGGKGQHYHQGEEGTNDGLSYANLLRFEDLGHVVWWTSDATAAYRIDNYHIFKVLRTVIFAKPDIVLVLDQVKLRYRPQAMDVRFFPDNRDDAAVLETDGSTGFTIRRPRACLHGQAFARAGLEVRAAELKIADDPETFPYIELHSKEALHHEVLTVLSASAADAEALPEQHVEATPEGWSVKAGRLRALVLTGAQDPAVTLL